MHGQVQVQVQGQKTVRDAQGRETLVKAAADADTRQARAGAQVDRPRPDPHSASGGQHRTEGGTAGAWGRLPGRGPAQPSPSPVGLPRLASQRGRQAGCALEQDAPVDAQHPKPFQVAAGGEGGHGVVVCGAGGKRAWEESVGGKHGKKARGKAREDRHGKGTGNAVRGEAWLAGSGWGAACCRVRTQVQRPQRGVGRQLRGEGLQAGCGAAVTRCSTAITRYGTAAMPHTPVHTLPTLNIHHTRTHTHLHPHTTRTCRWHAPMDRIPSCSSGPSSTSHWRCMGRTSGEGAWMPMSAGGEGRGGQANSRGGELGAGKSTAANTHRARAHRH